LLRFQARNGSYAFVLSKALSIHVNNACRDLIVCHKKKKKIAVYISVKILFKNIEY
jgi:hypothetical protein